jgi:hypothetical protein
MKNETFNAERISKSATITLNADIETVFPLFGPVEEKKWADGWDPVILSPASATIEKGLVFTTPASGEGEDKYAWIVAKFQAESHIVEYVVSTPNRIWVISIRCTSGNNASTNAAITYTYTGLNVHGNALNKRAIENMFSVNLKDWEEEINFFLKNGNTLKHQ